MPLLCFAIRIALLVILARIILSWVPLTPGGAAHRVAVQLDRITDPVLKPVRTIVPAVRMGGGMALDLSPLIVTVLLLVISRIVC